MTFLGVGLLVLVFLALAIVPMLFALFALWQGERARKR
jgi:hypothetical protein